jgi:hypothetical protein
MPLEFRVGQGYFTLHHNRLQLINQFLDNHRLGYKTIEPFEVVRITALIKLSICGTIR